MKKRTLGVIALTLAASSAMTGCRFIDDLLKPTISLKDSELTGEKVIDFANGADPDVFFESDGWTNGDVFNTVWTKENVKYENGVMELGITEEKKTASLDRDGDGEAEEVEFDYTSGEARSQLYYGYGDYEVSMKPSANPGTASAFFTCTGNYDVKYVLDEDGDYVLDEDGNRVTQENPWDEIDIEFLGQDTTRIQFNYFVNGVGGHEYMYDLGFDASKEFHEYGFRWEADAVTWFVDNKPVYKVTTDESVKEGKNVVVTDVLPSTAGRMLANYWCGTERAEGWMGKYKGMTKDNGTQYQWIATSAVGAPLNPEEKVDIPEGEDVSVNVSDITVEGDLGLYTVTKDTTANTLNVQYTDIAGASYKNINWNVASVAATKNVFKTKITNNGTETATVRIDVNSETTVNNTIAANVSATQDGVEVYTDITYGGSTFTVEAGATVEAVIVYNASRKPTNVMIYCDTSVYTDSGNTHSGNVTFSEMAFSGEYIPEENPNQPGENPEQPTTGTALNFSAEENTGYTLNNNGEAVETINVKYNGAGNTWKPITAEVAALAAGNDTFTVTIKNNGAADARVRVDVQGTTWVSTGDGSGTDACNVSAVGGDVWTDTAWGGSTLTVAANAEETLVITYNGKGAQGAVRNVLVYVDSARGDEATYDADITLSNMAFTSSSEYTSLAFTTEVYTIDPNDTATESLNVTYENLSGGTYKNVCAQISDIGNENNTFSLTIKNNGEASVLVRIDIKGTNTVVTDEAQGASTNICNTAVTGEGAWVDLVWGGAFVNVAAGAEVTLTVSYNPNGDFGAVTELLIYFDTSTYGDTNVYSGNVTISNFKFSNVEA